MRVILQTHKTGKPKERDNSTPMAGNSASSPNKRLKTVVGTQNLSLKFKSKVEDEPNQREPHENERPPEDSASRRCAICFMEDGKAIRGEIDCCDHYFCFLCIMEWAKTESRCPICRRRFSFIRRPPKEGAFAQVRVIKVPVRDQALLHSGNTDGSFDPYADVLCNVCHLTTDENLLLLCDLCDSAAHTYCVGLGFTVPEGDWFCHDCTISRADYANSENTGDENQNSMPLDASNVVEKLRSRVHSDSNKLLSPAVPQRGAGFMDEIPAPGARILPNVAKKLVESGARTLDRCRSVHGNIRALRQNWNALRSGSLSFPSSSFNPHCYNQEHEKKVVMHKRSGEVESSSSKSCQQSKEQGGFGSYDIDRAWKMMDIAKSKQCARGKTSCLQSSKLPPSKASASKESTNVNLNHLRKGQQFRTRNLGITGMEKPFKHCSFRKEVKKQQSLEFEKDGQSIVVTKEVAGGSSSLSTNYSPRLFEPPLSKKSFTSTGDNTSKEDGSILFKENINRASSITTSEPNGSASSVRQGTSDFFDVRSELSASSSMADVTKGNTRLKIGCIESKVIMHGDMKSEIQSLVKFNLKLLSRDKQLGVAAFKEIARLATHTILAACGLEHRKKYGFYSIPSLECSHTDLFQKQPQSNIMAHSCRQCFNSFVKNVVNSIMSHKLGCV